MQATTVITGASGFIGRAVVAQLLQDGESVAAFVRDEPTVALLGEHPRLRILRTSIDTVPDAAASLAKVAPIRAVIHLAGGRAAGGLASLEQNLQLNVAPTASVVGALEGHKHATFVLASTGEIYGSQPGPFVETLAVRPPSPYAIAKHAAETFALDAARTFGLSVVVARLGVVYGPRQDTRAMLVPALLEACTAAKAAAEARAFPLSPGDQTRDFVFVADCARALIALSKLERAGAEIVNVGTGIGLPVKVVATKLVAASGSPLHLDFGAIPHRPGDVMDYRLSTEKLERLTDFCPHVDIDEGLAQTVAAG